MKKLIFVAVLTVTFLSGFSQYQGQNDVELKNLVKFLPVNVLFNSISFEYERMISPKNSVILGIGIPTNQSFNGKYGSEPSTDVKNDQVGTMHIRTAFRHYTGKSMLPKGFYFEPYLKYQNINGKMTYSGVDQDTKKTHTGDFDINLHSVNAGFQLGAQFLIAKRVSLDLYFLGLEAGFLSGNTSATIDNTDDATKMKNDIKDALVDFPSIIANKLTVTQSGNKVSVDAKNLMYPWLRGGISIGIAF
jgi:hypothetical protein